MRRCGYVDGRRFLKIPRIYGMAVPFHDGGLHRVYLDRSGRVAIDIPLAVANAAPFHHGMA
jgi:hypothetical protein